MSLDVSIIIPVYNEEKNISLLYEKIVSSLKLLKKSYEIIFVDDGSRDKTFELVKDICKKDMKVRCLKFQKNFGKSATYTAGFEQAKGNIIITMDGDLQDDPVEIPRFLEAIKHHDLVVGWKYPRRDPLHKIIPSKIFNYLNYKLFRVRVHDNDCGYRAMKSVVAKDLSLYGDLYRFIPALASRMGYRVGEIKVRHHKRLFGKSKYGSGRLVTGSLDLLTAKFITDFNQRPMHLFGTTGLIFFGFGFLAELYVTFLRLAFQELFRTHMAMIILGALLMILGVQLLGIGLIGELIVSSKRNVKRYKLRKIIN